MNVLCAISAVKIYLLFLLFTSYVYALIYFCLPLFKYLPFVDVCSLTAAILKFNTLRSFKAFQTITAMYVMLVCASEFCNCK